MPMGEHSGSWVIGRGLEAFHMGRISTGIGLISGINSAQIIDQLMLLEARPKTMIQARIDQTNQQKLAYTDISTRLTSLKLSATTLKRPPPSPPRTPRGAMRTSPTPTQARPRAAARTM